MINTNKQQRNVQQTSLVSDKKYKNIYKNFSRLQCEGNNAAAKCYGAARSGKRAAFTLAEVLITLGIIGIVAAMTLPALIQKNKKIENETRLKKTYSVLSQALLMSVAKDGYLITDNFADKSDEDLKDWFDYYMKPYLKIMKVCYNEAGCWHEGNTNTLNNGTLYYDKGSIGIGTNIINFITLDGVTVNIDVYGSGDAYNRYGVKSENTYSLVMFIDINGKTIPNTVGKDIFIYVFTGKGLVPAGKDMTQEEVEENCSVNGNGFFCAAKIMSNNWQFGDENL